MNAAERREFVRSNHTMVVGYTRNSGPPSMSIVYYTMDGDDILFSTMAGRQKAKAVKRLGELSLCILDGQWPPTYIVVDGGAVVEEDIELVTDVGMAIGAVMSGETLPEEVRPLVKEGMEREDRVVIRVKPQSTFHSPPVHLEKDDDLESEETQDKMKHGYGARLDW
jgi:PPOX class probable F420-dependent enzyme